MDEITKIMYWISTGLLIPVIILLLFLFLKSLILTGSFYGLYIQKNKFSKLFRHRIETMDKTNIRLGFEGNIMKSKLLLSVYLTKLYKTPPSAVHYDKILDDFEIACQKDLAGSQLLAKLGPVAGLMGTLIPMGPALVGLAAGDIASMASNMQIAFATTVIGLFAGGVGFVVLQVKRRWYASDIATLEFVAALLKESLADEHL